MVSATSVCSRFAFGCCFLGVSGGSVVNILLVAARSRRVHLSTEFFPEPWASPIPRSPLLLHLFFHLSRGPRRNDAVHASISHRLTEMFMSIGNDQKDDIAFAGFRPELFHDVL